MNGPLVSIIIPTCNRAAYLTAALESVLAQDYAAKEIIVVDDGSTDETAEVCARFPVVYLRQENRGPSAARNLGVSRCQGGLLAFPDDDDLCPPGSLRVRVEHWRRDADCHHLVGTVRRFSGEAAEPIQFIDSEEQARNFICLGAEVMMRSAFEEAGGFDEALRMGEDVDLWGRMREAGLTRKFIPEITLYYRRHPGNSTHDPQVAQHGILKTLRASIQRKRQGGRVAS